MSNKLFLIVDDTTCGGQTCGEGYIVGNNLQEMIHYIRSLYKLEAEFKFRLYVVELGKTVQYKNCTKSQQKLPLPRIEILYWFEDFESFPVIESVEMMQTLPENLFFYNDYVTGYTVGSKKINSDTGYSSEMKKTIEDIFYCDDY